ncbi:ComEC/Rec2 family competence protein [Campylobacter sp. US33a]|uniref:ComEC/Rec2 family competence protein n=1 Tax=Campylobacter sp. US33a TaxID=2498120 RepID=UPI0038B37E02
MFKEGLNFKLSFIKNFLILIGFCLCIFIFNLFYEYQNFLNFKQNKHQTLSGVKVLQSYEKTRNNKVYKVFKLQNSQFTFYTTSYKKDLDLKKYQEIKLRIINTNVSFKDYLSKNFYMPSYDISIENSQTTPRNQLIAYFLNQHQNEKIKELFGALFFALPVSKELRNDVNHYGIAHLIAISGYHIALIFSLIFFLLSPIYGFFQKRYFPYRNLKLDLSVFIFILLFLYGFMIGFVPSFIRSLIMALWGFYLIAKNVKILSFHNLFMSILFCICLFPQLLFSLGFLFSIMGVFFIFLYLHHFSKYFNNFFNVIFLNIWTFFAMIIPVLYFFPLISYQQLLAIILSFAFVIFYPLSLFLHIIGFGGFFDEYLQSFLNLKFYASNFFLHGKYFYSYIFLSFLSIFNKYLALFIISLNFLPFILLLF